MKWEVEVGGAGESGGRKMETTVLEQPLKKKERKKRMALLTSTSDCKPPNL